MSATVTKVSSENGTNYRVRKQAQNTPLSTENVPFVDCDDDGNNASEGTMNEVETLRESRKVFRRRSLLASIGVTPSAAAADDDDDDDIADEIDRPVLMSNVIDTKEYRQKPYHKNPLLNVFMKRLSVPDLKQRPTKTNSSESADRFEATLTKVKKIGSSKKFIIVDLEKGSFSCYRKKPTSIKDNPKWSLLWNHWSICDVINDESMFYLYESSADELINNKKTSARVHIFKCPNGSREKLKLLQLAAYLNAELPSVKRLVNPLNTRIARTRKDAKEIVHDKIEHIHDQLEKFGTQKKKLVESHNVTEIKAQPEYAYPHRWFTVEELIKEMNKPSENILDLRNSNGTNHEPIGYLFVEVLTCVGLHRSRSSVSNVSCSTLLVCGNTSFRTDKVVHEINPMWLCRAKRSVLLPIYHIFAQLYVGIFHHYKSTDDLVGRVVLEISKFRPNTQYDVVLPLKDSGDVFEKSSKGVMRMRFEMEFREERSVLFSYLSPLKDNMLVSTSNDREFKQYAELLHGKSYHHLKYSNRHSRAVFRENKLYRIEFEMLLKKLIIDTCMWKIPCFSAYMFCSWMFCIYKDSFSLVLPASLGAVLVILFQCYHVFVLDQKRTLGFDGMTFSELLKVLLFDDTYGSNIMPLTKLNKKADFEHSKPCNHMLFPFSFSQRDGSYSVSKILNDIDSPIESGESLKMRIQNHIDDKEEGDNEEDDIGGADDESDSEKEQFSSNRRSSINLYIPSKEVNQDIHSSSSKSKTIKEELWQLESNIHKLTGSLFKQEIYINDGQYVKEGKSCQKVLGIAAAGAPLDYLKNEYVGPVIRIFFCFNLMFRSIFNLLTWRDPIATFWFTIILAISIITLTVFPWRYFFFVLGLLFFGPQNIIISQNKQSINFMIQIYHHVYQRLWSRFFFRKIVNVYSEGIENKSFFDKDASVTKATGTFKREIIVPYGRLKRERFYDWPPLPKASSAKASKANTISSRFPLSANNPKLITLTKCRYRYSDK